MQYLLSLALLAMTWCACGETTSSSEKETSDIKEEVLFEQRENLSQLYHQYHANRKNWFRSKNIPERGKVNSFDEALVDTSFFVFREELLSIIETKEILGLLDVVDENIEINKDSIMGIAGFIDQWNLSNPEAIEVSSVWVNLKHILTNGGYFNRSKTTFTAPYYSGNKKLIASNQACILGQGVRIRNRPGLNAVVIKKASYDIVEVLEIMEKKEMIGEEVYPWVRIQLPSGKEGYIWGKFLGTGKGKQVIFKKNNRAEWKIVVFHHQ